MNPETFDAIGTGQSGPSLAVDLANSGRRVAGVERGRFGGTCVKVLAESVAIHPTVSELLPTTVQSFAPLVN